MTPRGIRNCNPLNIRRSKEQWKGLAERQQDAAFCQFKSLEYGWRAAFYLLTRTYYHKHRLYTIRTIIRRWAPESENNTEAYIQNVSKLTGILPDEPLGIPSEQPTRWIALGAAMAIQENGGKCVAKTHNQVSCKSLSQMPPMYPTRYVGGIFSCYSSHFLCRISQKFGTFRNNQ